MRHEFATREEWLAARGLGASDIAAALGLSPYQSAYELWAIRSKLLPEPDLSDRWTVQAGIALEPVVERWYAEENAELYECDFSSGRHVLYTHDEYPWLTASPDSMLVNRETGEEGVLQLKTTSIWNADAWVGGAPLIHQVQVQGEMACTGLSFAVLACMLGDLQPLYAAHLSGVPIETLLDMARSEHLQCELRYYVVPRNERFIEWMLAGLRTFLDHVESGNPPAPDGSDSSYKTMVRLLDDTREKPAELNATADLLCEQYEELLAEERSIAIRKKAVRNSLVHMLDKSPKGTTPAGRRVSCGSKFTISPPRKDSP